jgi:hypothetical protein
VPPPADSRVERATQDNAIPRYRFSPVLILYLGSVACAIETLLL